MNKPGIRIGRYRITPLGMTVLAALLVVILGLIIIFTTHRSSGPDNVRTVSGGLEGGSISVATAEPPIIIATATPIPTQAPTPVPATRKVTIRSLGEIAIEEPLLEAAKSSVTDTYDFTAMFSMISDVMGDADLTVADVEGVMSDTSEYKFKSDSISTPSSLIKALRSAGVDMLTLANDHSLDNGWDGLKAEISNCIANGMDYIGANSSQEEKDTPVIREINGIRIGFMNYTDSVGGKQSKADKAGTEYGVNWTSMCSCENDAAALREAGADVIIAYVSWGEMFNRNPTQLQYEIAKSLADVGVDVVIGYNPHVLQSFLTLNTEIDGAEHTTYVLGATGNFLSNRRDQYTDSGVVLQFDVYQAEDGSYKVGNFAYVPTYVWRQDNGDGTYEYRTLAVGQWLETQPEGMSYADYTRLKQVWAEAQSVLGSELATCLHE